MGAAGVGGLLGLEGGSWIPVPHLYQGPEECLREEAEVEARSPALEVTSRGAAQASASRCGGDHTTSSGRSTAAGAVGTVGRHHGGPLRRVR